MFKLAIFNTQPPHIYFGGVERRIIEFSRRLSGKMDITVYCGTKAGFRKACHFYGVKMVPYFSTDLFFPVDNWFFNMTLRRTFDKIKADIYESHTVSGYGLLKALEKRMVKKPLIEVVHGVLADEYFHSYQRAYPTVRTKFSRIFMRYISKLEKELAQKSTLIVTVSNYSFRKIIELYDVDEEKIRVVPNGVDLEIFRPIEVSCDFKRRLGIEGRRCILFVGSLIPRKGLNFLIEAAAYIAREEKDMVFLIVGDGPLRNYLISLSSALGVRRNFIFLGRIPDDVLPMIYNCADIFVLPSVQEGQGITLLEAQACAKPIVAFNVGGVRECVKHGETGLLVEPDSFKLGEAVLKLLRDESLRARMGIIGRRFVFENFSWDFYAGRMFKVYLEALEY
ncbi:MAG: glycosyltransferase family 4 protein [Fervidobacterium sp.]